MCPVFCSSHGRTYGASSCDAFPVNGSWFPNADAMATPDRSAYDVPVSRFVLLLLLLLYVV